MDFVLTPIFEIMEQPKEFDDLLMYQQNKLQVMVLYNFRVRLNSSMIQPTTN